MNNYTSDAFGETFQDIFRRVLDTLGDSEHDFTGVYTSSGEPLMKNLKGIISNTGGFGAVDLEDSEQGVVVRVDLPGVDKKDIRLDVTRKGRDHVMKIEVERKPSIPGQTKHGERFMGKKKREVVLPSGVDPALVNAKYENGVLIVEIQKVHQETTSKSIPVL